MQYQHEVVNEDFKSRYCDRLNLLSMHGWEVVSAGYSPGYMRGGGYGHISECWWAILRKPNEGDHVREESVFTHDSSGAKTWGGGGGSSSNFDSAGRPIPKSSNE